jgi:NAD(P)-dependent dehydrogenase (short-subunit alcohol dehydrogenase family)
MAGLQNKVAIVTGASREIGAAMAMRLAAAGAAVLVNHYGEPERAKHVVDAIVAAGGQALTHEADLASVTENRALVARAVEAFGRLDIFVANAGLTIFKPFLETDEREWDTLANLNLKGSFFGAQAAALQMIAQGAAPGTYGGRIVFSSSVTGVVAAPGLTAYGITKAGLRHMAVTLAAELGRYGITVNALGIGATVNERNLANDPLYAEHWASVIPMGRAIQPDDVAAALMFLVSPETQMVTGHTLLVEGGWTKLSPAP